MTIEEKEQRAEFWLCLALAVVAITILGLAINDAMSQYPTLSGPFWSPQDWEREHGGLGKEGVR